jgi:hypothetical protein
MIRISIGIHKNPHKKNHPNVFRPLPKAIIAPMDPGIPHMIAIIISSGMPIPNIFQISANCDLRLFYRTAFAGVMHYHDTDMNSCSWIYLVGAHYL